MAKKIVLILVLVSVSLGLFQYFNTRVAPDATPVVTISVTKDGFSPSEVTIRKGEGVEFLNAGDEYVWPASDLHPTHELYPEFDPREPLAPGDSWMFVFEQAGTWQMHDHLKARSRGAIHVTE